MEENQQPDEVALQDAPVEGSKPSRDIPPSRSTFGPIPPQHRVTVERATLFGLRHWALGLVDGVLGGRSKVRAARAEAGWSSPHIPHRPTNKRREPIDRPYDNAENYCRTTEPQEKGHGDTEQPRGRYANRGRERGDSSRHIWREHEKRVGSIRIDE